MSVRYEISDDLEVLIRYEFSTDDGSAWSVPLRPAAVLANCQRNSSAAFELGRYEVIAQRLVARGMPREDVHRLLSDISNEVLGEVLADLEAPIG